MYRFILSLIISIAFTLLECLSAWSEGGGD